METATKTLTAARNLVNLAAARGYRLDVADAYLLARIGQQVGREAEAEIARQARQDRVRRGMVANWCSDMRAVGAWDGE